MFNPTLATGDHLRRGSLFFKVHFPIHYFDALKTITKRHTMPCSRKSFRQSQIMQKRSIHNQTPFWCSWTLYDYRFRRVQGRKVCFTSKAWVFISSKICFMAPGGTLDIWLASVPTCASSSIHSGLRSLFVPPISSGGNPCLIRCTVLYTCLTAWWNAGLRRS
jgi:hypothetical protein